MPSFLSRFRKKPVTQVRLIEREACHLTLEEWRSDPLMVKQARDVVRKPAFRHMLDVLRTAHFANYHLPATADTETRAFQQARCEGYSMALSNLEAMAEFEKPFAELTETFETPEEPTATAPETID